jgi:hypothetical protein
MSTVGVTTIASLVTLESMAAVAADVFSYYFTPNCCIGATRVGIEVLRRFGITGRPLPAIVIGMNAPAREHTERGGIGDPPSDARVLIVDHEAKGDGYAGHLVIVGKVQGSTFMLDLSATQFDRPQKQIYVPRALLAVKPTKNGVALGPKWQITADLDRGGMLVYEPHPHPDASWKTAPDWTAPQKKAERFREICRLLERKVADEILTQT